jgi:mannose-6-phosphate isomerase
MGGAPRRLSPRFVERIWGTTKLSPYFPDSATKIGEVWFSPGDDYPVLVKFIFTSERLSVQVHPDDVYAREREHSRGKTEMWHILAAEPGAKIAIGFREFVSRERLQSAIDDGSIEGLLNWVPVAPGDTYFTDAGVVHAIGAGVTLCEIQQNSDVTYRLYDYGRDRELHVAKALDVLETGTYDARRQLPVACDHFSTEMMDVDADGTDIEPDCLMIALAGDGQVDSLAFQPGEVWHLPGNSRPARLRARKEARLLRVTCPELSSAWS